MKQLEHTENLVLQLSRHELAQALRHFGRYDETWILEDVDITHNGEDMTTTIFLTRYKMPA